MERLDKFLCDCGAGTRSQVKQILKAGRVTVDGQPERDGSRKVEPASQTVTLDGTPLGRETGTVVVMLHKPAGYVTATEDAQSATVMELLPEALRQLEMVEVRILGFVYRDSDASGKKRRRYQAGHCPPHSLHRCGRRGHHLFLCCFPPPRTMPF